MRVLISAHHDSGNERWWTEYRTEKSAFFQKNLVFVLLFCDFLGCGWLESWRVHRPLCLAQCKLARLRPGMSFLSFRFRGAAGVLEFEDGSKLGMAPEQLGLFLAIALRHPARVFAVFFFYMYSHVTTCTHMYSPTQLQCCHVLRSAEMRP